ncbi:MAG: ATP-binding protein [Oscillospiraceae bacterium]|nr:ATP-binding protein [Oscillospiraceae bacterium]
MRKKPSPMSKFIIFSLSLFLIILAGGGAVFVFSMREIVKENKSVELSQLLEIERIRLEAYVQEGISVALKFTSSPVITEYFVNPENGENADSESAAWREMNSYRETFADSHFFWVSDVDKRYYFDGEYSYTVDVTDPENAWYTRVLNQPERYTLDINYNPGIERIMMWIDATVVHEGGVVGLAGTGTDVTEFLDNIYGGLGDNTDKTLYFFDADGVIRGDSNIENVYNKVNIAHELSGAGLDFVGIAGGLSAGDTALFSTAIGEIAVGTVPLVGWYSVAVSPTGIADYNTALTALFLVVTVLVLLIIVIFNVVVYGFLRSLNAAVASLEAAKNEAVAANNSKTNFLTVMSREIRNSLTSIIGITQTEMRNNELPCLTQIMDSGNSLLEIFDNISDISKVESGTLEIVAAEYDLPELISETARDFTARIAAKPIELTLDIDRNLPEKLIGDKLRLGQILNNLLLNAIRHTDEGFVKLSVYHKRDGDDVALRFRVEDSGRGIDEQELRQLFSAYTRLTFDIKTDKTIEEMALGLNITQKLVEIMQGKMEAESVPGTGSIFTATVRQGVPVGGCRAIGVEVARGLGVL